MPEGLSVSHWNPKLKVFQVLILMLFNLFFSFHVIYVIQIRD